MRKSRALAAIALAGSFTALALPLVSSGGAGAAGPTVNANTFQQNFSTMAYLKAITTKGKGKIAEILPDTTSSARYVDFDAPMMKEALTKAGMKSSQFIIQNGEDSDNLFYTDAVADIANGAKVLIIDPEDSTTGEIVEAYAASRGVKVIDYDRLTLGGQRSYYVSFNNVTVGTQLGQGLVACIAAWNVSKPHLYVMYGSPTDNNATLFGKGYNAVLTGAGYAPAEGGAGSSNTTDESVGTWTPSQALTDFEGAFTATPSINAVLTPNDENAGPIITYLQSKGVKPDTIPFTGQDATPEGFQNIISGYQCGTVYKPIYKEAQAAAALAIYLRAGVKPPAGLINAKTSDPDQNITKYKSVPSVLETSSWVTASTIQSTIIAQHWLTAADICTNTAPTVAGATEPTYAADCTKYGIS
ncbi:MAG: sugar ABC transporter substrate-binding protein [Acidimicrobiales bacterium]